MTNVLDGIENITLMGPGPSCVDESCRLPMLNSVYIPEGVDDAIVRSSLLKEHKIEIGAGLGPLAGKIRRIGLMGHTARPENVEKLIGALKSVCH